MQEQTNTKPESPQIPHPASNAATAAQNVHQQAAARRRPDEVTGHLDEASRRLERALLDLRTLVGKDDQPAHRSQSSSGGKPRRQR